MMKGRFYGDIGLFYCRTIEPDPPVPLTTMQDLARTPDDKAVPVFAGAVPVHPKKTPLADHVINAT